LRLANATHRGIASLYGLPHSKESFLFGMTVLGCGLFFGNLVVVLVVLSHELYQEVEPDSLCRGVLVLAGNCSWLTECERKKFSKLIAKAISVEIVYCGEEMRCFEGW
jgi:hypothetical protein